MANPLARVMMDQMSKKSGKIKSNTYDEQLESRRNLDEREEAILSGLIHHSDENPQATSFAKTSNHRGKRMKLEDIAAGNSSTGSQISETPSTNHKKSVETKSRGAVKDPYGKGSVRTSVVANPGKGVSSVSLQSLGKRNQS